MSSCKRSGCFAWWGSESYSSSSMKLLLFMVPLIMVAGLVSVLGPNPSGWALIQSPSLLWTSVTSSNGGAVTTTTMEASAVSSKREGSEGLVVVAVDFHNKEEKAIISDDSAFNHSFTPPLSIQAIQQSAVRLYFLLLIQIQYSLKLFGFSLIS